MSEFSRVDKRSPGFPPLHEPFRRGDLVKSPGGAYGVFLSHCDDGGFTVFWGNGLAQRVALAEAIWFRDVPLTRDGGARHNFAELLRDSPSADREGGA